MKNKTVNKLYTMNFLPVITTRIFWHSFSLCIIFEIKQIIDFLFVAQIMLNSIIIF